MINKYYNIKTVIDGIKFDSKKEAKRYQELKLLERTGEIKNLKLQVKFSIDIYGKHICNYIADFTYDVITKDRKTHIATIVEDCKGMKTPVYNLKKKLMLAVNGIAINEV